VRTNAFAPQRGDGRGASGTWFKFPTRGSITDSHHNFSTPVYVINNHIEISQLHFQLVDMTGGVYFFHGYLLIEESDESLTICTTNESLSVQPLFLHSAMV
jgi:hypothetical protein